MPFFCEESADFAVVCGYQRMHLWYREGESNPHILTDTRF